MKLLYVYSSFGKTGSYKLRKTLADLNDFSQHLKNNLL